MSIIYLKSSLNRKREFQIKTLIREEKDQRIVVKEAVYKEGENHISKTFSNEKLAEMIYGDMVVHSNYKEHKLIMPYYEGVSLGRKLERLLLDPDEKRILALLELWRSVIIGLNNDATFNNSSAFQEVFGNATELFGDEAVRIANMDCSSENILFTGAEELKVIDYEWFFNFEVPIDLIFYRVLKLFYENSSYYVEFNYLLELAKIDRSKIEVYERCLQNLNSYIFYDENSNVNYASLGTTFTTPKFKDNAPKDYLYRFPDEKIPEGSSIVLYGAGRVGQDYYHCLKANSKIQLVAWVDKKGELYRKIGLPVYKPEQIPEFEFDYVLIAVKSNKVANSIVDEIVSLGIARQKILWFE